MLNVDMLTEGRSIWVADHSLKTTSGRELHCPLSEKGSTE